MHVCSLANRDGPWEAIPLRSNGNKEDDGVAGLYLKKGQEERWYKEFRRYIGSGPHQWDESENQ